jgi:hypothetical protein
LLREFDRITDKIGEDLPDAERIADKLRGALDHFHANREPFLLGKGPLPFDRRNADFKGHENHPFQIQLAGFQLREIQQVVQDPGRLVELVEDRLGIAPLIGSQFSRQQYLGITRSPPALGCGPRG